MNIKILEEKDNAILKRKELLLEVDSLDKTPSNEEVKKELAKKFNTKENLVAVKQINQIFGKRTCKVKANIYNDEKSLKEIEPQPKVKEEPKKEEAPAEAPKPEAPKETPVETKPEEKKEQVPAEQPKEVPKEEPKEEKKE